MLPRWLAITMFVGMFGMCVFSAVVIVQIYGKVNAAFQLVRILALRLEDPASRQQLDDLLKRLSA